MKNQLTSLFSAIVMFVSGLLFIVLIIPAMPYILLRAKLFVKLINNQRLKKCNKYGGMN